jgi:hypothetical protein
MLGRKPWKRNDRKPSLELRVEELPGRVMPSVSAPLVTTDTNWSGYAAETDLTTPLSGAVTAVGGTWVVPAVTGSRGYSAAWVGIDGYTSSTVEQIGTEQDVSSRGAPTYYAWYEFYPNNAVTISNFPVAPGDVISAEVSYASGSFTLQMTDRPQSGGAPTTFSVTKTAPGALESSAEWIMEAPSARNTLPLANFGTISFTNAWATISGVTGPIDDPAWQAAEINIVSSGGFRGQTGTTKATTSALTGSAPPAGDPLPPPAGTVSVSAFNVAYGAGTPPPPAPTASGPSGTIDTDLPTFSWNNVTGASSYEVWLTDQTTGSTVTVPNILGTSWTPAQALTLGDNYTWWVGAVAGTTITWDNPLKFIIQPTAIAPSGSIATNSPTFSWNSVTGAASYEVWLTDQTTGATVTIPNISGTSWTPPKALTLGDNYIWWAGAVQGQTIAWDNPLKFIVQPTATGPSGVVATNLPTFTWNNVTGAVSYKLWLTDQTTHTTVTVPNLTDTSWTPAQPLTLGDSYIWWVGAVEGQTVAWDNSLTFVIEPTASGPSGIIATDLPTFSWSSVTGATSYEIWLTDQTTGTSVTVPNLTGTSWTPAQALNLGDNYIWWVGAVQGQTIAWDNPLTFVAQPTATAPSGTVVTNMPTFSWNNVTGATSYEIWLTDQTAGTSLTYANLTVTSWTPPQALTLGDDYIWWVAAVQGKNVAWDAALTFTVG